MKNKNNLIDNSEDEIKINTNEGDKINKINNLTNKKNKQNENNLDCTKYNHVKNISDKIL